MADMIQRDSIGPVIVAGSTLEGEEAMLLDAFRVNCGSATPEPCWFLRRGIPNASTRLRYCLRRRDCRFSGARC